MDALIFGGIVLAAYLAGSIPFGFLIGKFYGKDIRTLGSCNIGATNVTRVIGKVPGKICFFLDLLKGYLPVFFAGLIGGRLTSPWSEYLTIVTALAVILGHMFSIYLKFKGGKGVATSAGGILALAPLACITGLAVWVVVFKLSRYVSLGSIVAAAVLPVAGSIYNALGWNRLSAPVIFFLYFAGTLTIIKHHQNIRRLLNGSENRFEKKNK
ncbi:MAG: glycerol-3-phosphate 1-O-acyltransferase PlsY [Lentisphaeria bacterium]|nr:glycerol-3-phosphate 1-O-acyltransferase PlsY [Lentisphaeria bacterium]